jgi:hypothetical protein
VISGVFTHMGGASRLLGCEEYAGIAQGYSQQAGRGWKSWGQGPHPVGVGALAPAT